MNRYYVEFDCHEKHFGRVTGTNPVAIYVYAYSPEQVRQMLADVAINTIDLTD
jgi:hypothetical protein